MNPDRAIGAILALSLVVILGLGVWIVWRAHHPPEPPPVATASPSATPTETATATPSGVIPAAARGYRLAGTVVGDVTYAIIETPQGGSELLRPGQVLHGIGQLLIIDEHHVVIDGADGRFELQLASAPTSTPTPPHATPSPAPPTTPARSASESLPS
ncbi:MAG: hypothetical protein ACREMU_04560, partial [Gemmatimonadaceae bacterium]